MSNTLTKRVPILLPAEVCKLIELIPTKTVFQGLDTGFVIERFVVDDKPAVLYSIFDPGLWSNPETPDRYMHIGGNGIVDEQWAVQFQDAVQAYVALDKRRALVAAVDKAKELGILNPEINEGSVIE